MDQFLLLTIWLVSLPAATWLGIERGRWLAGLLLGLLCGPMGVVAAGLMQPALETAGARAYALHKQLIQLRRLEDRDHRERRRARAEFDRWVSDVEHQRAIEELGFAEGLQELAGELGALGDGGASPERMQGWAGWLKDKAASVRESPKYQREEI